MMRVSKIFLLFISVSFVFGQETEEKFLEEQLDGSEQSELLERIQSLKENPVNLNLADLQELEVLPGLTLKQRKAIVNYRKQKGPFKNIEELIEVPTMDMETIDSIREMITVEFFKPPSRPRFSFTTRIAERIDQPIGFQNGTYESSSQKTYNRLRFAFGHNIKGGLLLEKDSGEARLNDLSLFYLTSKIKENLTIAVGHFSVESGQGLVLWGPYGFAKSSATIFPTKKKGRGIKGYSSVDENSAFFGAAAALSFSHFEIISFISKNKLDGTLTTENKISSLTSTGFHRNENEMDKKDKVAESALGVRIRYTFSSGLSLGSTILYSSFDKTIENPDLTRNHFSFRGRTNAIRGIDLNWNFNNAQIFGEAAQSKSGGHAILLGSVLDFTPIHFALLYRNYSRSFHNFHAFGFGESNGNTQNERGYYLGLSYKISSKTNVRAYLDSFSSPWRTFFEPLPVEGHEILLQIEQKFRRDIDITLRFRNDEKMKAANFEDEFGRSTTELVQRMRSQFRLQLDYRISKSLSFRNRIEFIQVKTSSFGIKNHSEKENGFLVYQDIKIKPIKKLQIQSRLTFFESDSFDSGLYQYENDLPGVVTNRALFGRGNRWYLLLKYKPAKSVATYLKYSETFRDDVDVIGSGPDQLNGNLDRRLSAQLELSI